jgi:hypothetical protein
MLTLITALKGLLSLISAVVGYFRDKLLINAGRDQKEAEQARENVHDLQKAIDARRAARERDANGVPDDKDKYRRD